MLREDGLSYDDYVEQFDISSVPKNEDGQSNQIAEASRRCRRDCDPLRIGGVKLFALDDYEP
jgi:hypothetical protein